MINIRLYDIFRKDLHLPDDKAHNLVEAIDEAVKDSQEENLKGLATIELVKEEIRATKEFVRQEIHTVKSDLQRVELKVEQTKSELTKAIFWASLVQFLAIVGAVIGIISFMVRK